MIYVAIFELMAEAVEQCGLGRSACIAALAFCAMTASQDHMKGILFDGTMGLAEHAEEL
jgi:hypothetical protein